MFSYKFSAYFQNPFSQEHLWTDFSDRHSGSHIFAQNVEAKSYFIVIR